MAGLQTGPSGLGARMACPPDLCSWRFRRLAWLATAHSFDRAERDFARPLTKFEQVSDNEFKFEARVGLEYPEDERQKRREWLGWRKF
jgi:hypothetical protein